METKSLLQKIKKEFPEISWKSVKRTKYNWDFYVLILDEKYVFRFARDKKCAEKFAKEIKLLDYLKKKTPILVPDYIFRSKDGRFAGYKIIGGGKLMPNEFEKLPLRNRKIIALQFADFLNVLHDIPKKLYKKFGIKIKTESSGTDKLFSRIRKTVFPKLSSREIEDIEEFFKKFKSLEQKPYKKVLIHGDLTKENFIYQKGKISGIIDFTDFSADEPALDFKGFWSFGLEFVEMVYENYRNKGDNFFIERSKLYFRIMSLYVLDGAVNCKYSPCDFKDAHKRFKKYFYI